MRLWLQGICELNNIYDWLILTQSEKLEARYRDVVLVHFRCLGLRLNHINSVLSPIREQLFWGWYGIQLRCRLLGTVYLPQEMFLAIIGNVRVFLSTPYAL